MRGITAIFSGHRCGETETTGGHKKGTDHRMKGVEDERK